MKSDISERLKTLRRTAWERYASLPWPVSTDEEWRRTDPEKFRINEKSLDGSQTGFHVGWEPASPALIHSGVILTDIKTALKQFPELIEQYIFQSGSPEGLQKFTALHEALSNDGLFCYVPEGVQVENPLTAWIEAGDGSAAIFPHSLIVIGKDASVTVQEHCRSSNSGKKLLVSHERVEIFLQEKAALTYVHLQEWNSSVSESFSQRAVLEQDAVFLNAAVWLGGALTKANIETVLRSSGSRAELLGVLCGRDKQHFDLHTLQDHKAPHTFSDLLYKSALKDSSKAVYTGLIRIEKAAQKSDAYQVNRNLILSQGATADSIPMLEIEANDVRCTHGVATGPVDEEQSFYLMSRGIPPAETEHLIVEGFLEQVFKRLPNENVRENLMTKVIARLGE